MINQNKSILSNAKILFLGYAIPDELFQEITADEPYPQIQGTKFIWRIIKGIEESSKSQLDLISVVPVSEYPRHPKIFFGYHKWKHRPSGGEDYIIPFINIIIIKHITRMLSSFFFVSRWLIKNKRYLNRKILIYAMHSPFIISALIATFMFGGKIFIIIPDFPAFMDLGMRRNILIRTAKKIDAFIMKKLLQRMSGIIALTEHAAKDISRGSIPSMVMEGIVDETNYRNAQCNDCIECFSNEKIIMYTGSLTGLEMLLKAFSQIDDPTFRLWISGRGAMEQGIARAAEKDGRIVYWGILSDEELNKKRSQATVLVNVRSSATPYIQYSFPSKLLEYMLTGRPIISTVLPGIPGNYHKYLFLLYDETPSGLAALLQDICNKSASELAEIGQMARKYVIQEKNYLCQGEKMFRFIQSC